MFYHSEASTQASVLKPPFQTSWSMFGKDADLKSAETYEGSIQYALWEKLQVQGFTWHSCQCAFQSF